MSPRVTSPCWSTTATHTQTSSSIQLQLESEKIKKAQTTYFIDVNIFAKSSNYLASIIGLPSLSFSSPNHMVAYPP